MISTLWTGEPSIYRPCEWRGLSCECELLFWGRREIRKIQRSLWILKGRVLDRQVKVTARPLASLKFYDVRASFYPFISICLSLPDIQRILTRYDSVRSDKKQLWSNQHSAVNTLVFNVKGIFKFSFSLNMMKLLTRSRIEVTTVDSYSIFKQKQNTFFPLKWTS